MSVRLRLGVAFAVAIAMVLVPAAYAGVRLSELRDLAVEGRRQHAAATLAVGELHAELTDFDRLQRAYLATLDPRIGPSVEESLRRMGERLERLQATGYRGPGQALARDLDSLAVVSRGIDALIRADEVDAATETYESVTRVRDRLARELGRVATAIDRASAADFQRAEAVSSTAATTTIVAILVAVLVALVVGAWTTGALTVPLRRLSRAAARVEAGSLEAPADLPFDRRDEVGDLSRSFRAMTHRLAELDRQKAEFMSVASHELKTPISAANAYVELLKMDLGEAMTEQQRKNVEGILEQTDVLVRLVHRLLSIGRLESGTYPLEIEPVDVQDLLEGLARTFRVLAEEQDVRLTVVADESAPRTIPADADLLRNQVLGNLLSNALRFTPPGGEIRVRVWGEDGHAVFEVSDTGPGVPEEKRDHIFDKYYQGGRTRFMGAGLGLAVVREVLEAHGGRVALEPTGDRGATFRVFVPINRPTSV